MISYNASPAQPRAPCSLQLERISSTGLLLYQRVGQAERKRSNVVENKIEAVKVIQSYTVTVSFYSARLPNVYSELAEYPTFTGLKGFGLQHSLEVQSDNIQSSELMLELTQIETYYSLFVISI